MCRDGGGAMPRQGSGLLGHNKQESDCSVFRHQPATMDTALDHFDDSIADGFLPLPPPSKPKPILPPPQAASSKIVGVYGGREHFFTSTPVFVSSANLLARLQAIDDGPALDHFDDYIADGFLPLPPPSKPKPIPSPPRAASSNFVGV